MSEYTIYPATVTENKTLRDQLATPADNYLEQAIAAANRYETCSMDVEQRQIDQATMYALLSIAISLKSIAAAQPVA